VRGRFMARQDTLLSLANIKAVNEKGQSSVDIDRIDHQVVNVQNLNFRLPAKHSGRRLSYFAMNPGDFISLPGLHLQQLYDNRRNIFRGNSSRERWRKEVEGL
jgi:hypothetical protein